MKKENIWDKTYKHFPRNESVWIDLDSKYDGASSYIIEEIKKLPKPVKILDAGCGDGRNLIYLRKKGYRVVGIDISEEAVRRVKNKLGSSDTPDVIAGDIRALPYENNSFDAIIYDLVNVHIENPCLVLKEFQRVLKPDGLLLFETTSKNDPLHKGKNKFFEKGFYFRFYGRQEVRKLVENFFRVKEVKSNIIAHRHHGKGYAKRKKHFHKSYLIVAGKIN